MKLFFLWVYMKLENCSCKQLLIHLTTFSETLTQVVGFLWTNDRSVAETFTWKQTTLKTDRYPCPPGEIRTHYLSRRAAADSLIRHQQIEVARTRKFCSGLRTERQLARRPTPQSNTGGNNYTEIINALRSRALNIMNFKFTEEVSMLYDMI